jgi:prepilin-type N-terminal cleavage/methylation domain-containing protein
MKPRQKNAASGFTLIEVIITLVVVAVVAAMMTAYFGTSITQSSLPISRLNATASLNEILEKISAQYGQYSHWRPDTPYAAGSIILPTTSKRNGLKYNTGGGTSCISPCTEPNWPATGTFTDGSVTWTQNGAAPTLINQTWRPSKPYSKNSIIVNGNYQYITLDGGTSGTSQPSWGTATTWTETESTGPLPRVIWKYSGNPAPTDILQTLIGAEGTDQTQTFLNETVSYRVIQNRFIKFDGSNQEVNINATPSDSQYGRYLKVTIALPSNPTGESLTTLFVLR